MLIPTEVLKDLGIEGNIEEGAKEELDMFAKLPYPMKSVNNQWYYDLATMRSKFEFIKSIYENASSYKCTEEEIYSMEAYDRDSLKFGQFLLDNMSRVCVWDGAEYKSAFIAFFTYSCRNHEIKFHVSGTRDEVMQILCENIEHSNLYEVIKKHGGAADFVKGLTGADKLEHMYAIIELLRANNKLTYDDVMLHVFSNCRFIPLIIIDPICNVMTGNQSFTFGDIKRQPNVMTFISDFLGAADVRPNKDKFYFVRRSSNFGYYLKKDDKSGMIANVTNLIVPEDSVAWREIKSNFGVRCGLNNYLADVDYLPADDIYYFIKVNETTNELWLKRDMGKSPKAAKHNNKKK